MLSNVFKFLGVASVDSNLMPNSSDSVIRIVVIPKESNSLNKYLIDDNGFKIFVFFFVLVCRFDKNRQRTIEIVCHSIYFF